MTTTTKSTIRRIQGLLALANNNPSEAEAALAAEKASALLAEHNLTAHDVSATEPAPALGHSAAVTKAGTPWIRHLWYAVAQLNFCDYAYSTGNHRTFHTIVGTELNVQVTISTAEYLTDAIRHLAKRTASAESESPRWRHAFNCGCGQRVTQRIRQRLSDLKAAKQTTTPIANSGNLPALYKDTAQELSQYVADNMGFGMAKAQRSAMVNASGRRAGYAAGNAIGIDTQIGSSHNNSTLLN